MSDTPELLPFQQLQQQFAAYIRDPEKNPYQPDADNAAEIESRRLKVYAELFFNNLYGLFSQVFPVCKQILGETRWREICRQYLALHQSKTPLFHQLAEEFLEFLNNEFEPNADDPAFLLELAHYEWVELVLAVSEAQDFPAQQLDLSAIDLDAAYQLSELALPLAYEWPVHQLSAQNIPTEKPEQVTTLLVYRQSLLQQNQDKLQSNLHQDQVTFMQLSPMLYQFLLQLEQQPSAKSALQALGLDIDQDENLQEFAKQTLQQLLAKGILRVA